MCQILPHIDKTWLMTPRGTIVELMHMVLQCGMLPFTIKVCAECPVITSER